MRLKGRSINSANTETGANTPCLKAFFRCLETSGSQMFSVQGHAWTCPGDSSVSPSPILYNQSGSSQTVQPVMAINQAPTVLNSGSWPVISSQSVLMMYAGRVNVLDGTAARFAIGDINNLLPGSNYQGLGMSDGPFHAAAGNGSSQTTVTRVELAGPVDPTSWYIADSTNYSSVPTVAFPAPIAPGGIQATGTAVLSGGTTGTLTGITLTNPGSGYKWYGSSITSVASVNGVNAVGFDGLMQSLDSSFNGQDVVVYLTYESGVQMAYTALQLTDPGSGTILRATNLLTPGATLTPGTFQPFACMRTANVAFYGAALYAFENGFPSDLQAGILANGGSWIQGKRYSYPGWIGRT